MKKLLLIFLVMQVYSQDKFFTYYNTWCMGADNQWTYKSSYYFSTKTFAQNLGNITHVMVFMSDGIVDSNYAPYLTITKDYVDAGGSPVDSINFWYNGDANPQSGEASWESRGTIFHLRDSLHAKGKYIILTIQAVSAAPGLNYVFADSTRTDVFTQSIADWLDRHNFDGVELNTESGITFTDAQLARFYRLLNQKTSKLLMAVPVVTHMDRYQESIDYIDYVAPQLYAYSTNDDPLNCDQNSTFLKIPLYTTNVPAGSNHQSINTWSPDDWYEAGWAKSKIVILMSTEADLFRGVDSMFACVTTGAKQFWADSAAYRMLNNGGTYTWDAVHIGGYISGTAITADTNRGIIIAAGQKFYMPVLADQNIDSVYNWGKAKGYTNFGMYDVSTDARTPDAVKMPRHAHLSSLLSPNKYLLWKR